MSEKILENKNVKESCSVSIVFNVSWLNHNLEVTVVPGEQNFVLLSCIGFAQWPQDPQSES